LCRWSTSRNLGLPLGMSPIAVTRSYPFGLPRRDLIAGPGYTGGVIDERSGAEDVGGQALLSILLLKGLLPEGGGELEDTALGQDGRRHKRSRR